MKRLFLNCALLCFCVGVGFSTLAVGSNDVESETQEQDENKTRITEVGSMEMQLTDESGARRLNEEPSETKRADTRRLSKNGAQIFEDIEGRRRIEIWDDEKKGIKVTVTMKYSNDELNKLVHRYPELGDYIQMFPKTVSGNQISMDLSVTSTHEAKNLEELKRTQPKAYNLYRRYYKKRSKSPTKKRLNR